MTQKNKTKKINRKKTIQKFDLLTL